mgnify:CR=1 FL=1
MRKVNEAGIDLIKSFEGLSLKPYLDAVGIPTIGYGIIEYPNGTAVTMYDNPITEDQALDYLQFEVNKKTTAIERMLNVEVNDNEFAALTAFAYNVGTRALLNSTLLKLLNSNSDRSAVADQFMRWNKAGGKELPGLTRRRQAEKNLFLTPIESDQDALDPIPSEEELNKKLQEVEDDILKE